MNIMIRAFVFGTLVSCALAARSEEINLTVDDPRPLSVVLDRLSTRLGYAITYEDPRYAYAGDLRDATAEIRRDGRSEPKIFVPLGGAFQLRRLSIPEVMNSRAAVEVMERVLEAQQESTLGGRFQLVRTGNMFHVVPKSVRNEQGEWIDQVSLLDARISIPKGEHSIWDMVDAICKAVGRANNVKVIFDAPLVRPMIGQGLVDGADDEVARDVLMRSLAKSGYTKSGYTMTWKLTYMPGPAWTGYVLSLVQLPSEPTLPSSIPVPNSQGSSTPSTGEMPGMPTGKILRR